MKKQKIESDRLCKPNSYYCHAVKVKPGHLLFIKGETARDKDFNLIGKGDVAAQARQIYENMKVILEEAGGTLSNIVKLTAYVRDISKLEALQAVRHEYFGFEPLAVATVEVSRLATEEILIEIEAIAALD